MAYSVLLSQVKSILDLYYETKERIEEAQHAKSLGKSTLVNHSYKFRLGLNEWIAHENGKFH